jgi:hypothetical protein
LLSGPQLARRQVLLWSSKLLLQEDQLLMATRASGAAGDSSRDRNPRRLSAVAAVGAKISRCIGKR